MFDVVDVVFGVVVVQVWLVGVLVECGLGWDVCWIGFEEGVYGFVVGLGDVLLGDGVGYVWVVYGGDVGVQQVIVGQFVEDGEDVVGVMYVFYVVFLDVWCYFVQLWYFV